MFRILAVNYHYVHPAENPIYPGLHMRTPRELGEQLDVLSGITDCLTPGEFENAFETGDLPGRKDRGFVLTFDDGLKDHVEFVAPVLEERGIKAFFFVNTAPWEGELLDVHKLQLLNSMVAFPKLYGNFLDIVSDLGIELDPGSIPLNRIRQQYRYDPEDVARFKYSVNFELDANNRSEVVAGLFHLFLGRDEDYVSGIYMSQADCKSLVDMGHEVGCHSHRHRALSSMEPDVIKDDLARNINSIVAATQITKPPSWISFPFGSVDAANTRVLDACENLGITRGFTMNREFIQPGALGIALNRVDTNDAPGGKSPVIGW